jgi:hypothetical protein
MGREVEGEGREEDGRDYWHQRPLKYFHAPPGSETWLRHCAVLKPLFHGVGTR